MDFSFSTEQLAFKDRVNAFAQKELNDTVRVRDQQGRFDRDLWKKCADFGIQSMGVPEPYSGRKEIDIFTAMLAMEGMGYGCQDNGLVFGLNAHIWTVQLPIVHFGTDQQKQRFLPNMCSGAWIGAHALTEPGSGSDAYSLQTTAKACNGGYRLNGKKRFITLAPEADLFLVFATVNPDLGKWGITVFLVARDTPGVAVSSTQDKMGLRTIPMAEVTFTDCVVSKENRIGKEGAGFSISNHSLEYERCSILAGQLGCMERQLETAIAYARERVQFREPIGKFQSVSNRIVDMKLRLETARLLLYKVAWQKRHEQPAMMEAALLKLYLSECFMDSSLDAIRVHGGLGYLTETGVERDLRDSVGGLLYAGTSDIQRNIVANLLGL